MASPKQHHGAQDFNRGELRNFRVQMFATLAEANAELHRATARIIWVSESQSYYLGHPGAWVKIAETDIALTGAGVSVGQVADPAGLNVQWPSFSLNITAIDDTASTITVVPDGQLDLLVAGDLITVTGSDDASGTWLDGEYTVVSANSGTGQIVVGGGSVPASTGTVNSYGSAEFSDQTYPPAGSIVLVNPDSDVGAPMLWVYDDINGVWLHLINLDPRLLFRDGSRDLTGHLPLGATLFARPARMELARQGIIDDVIEGTVTSDALLTDVTTVGAVTTVTFETDDTFTIEDGTDTVTITGYGAPLDGVWTINSSSVTPGSPNIVAVDIGDLGVNNATPAGTIKLTKPGQAMAVSDDIAAAGADLSAHVAAGDPHSQYATDAEVTAIANGLIAAAISGTIQPSIDQSMTDHLAAPDPHSQYATDTDAQSYASAAVSAHNSASTVHPTLIAGHNADPGAHNGLIAQMQAILSTGEGQGLTMFGQVIAPGTPWGVPVVMEAASGVFVPRTADHQMPEGIAGDPSSTWDRYTDMSITSSSAAKEVSLSGVATLPVGTRVEFVGSTNCPGYQRVISVDGGAMLLSPGPSGDGVESNLTVREYLADGVVYLLGSMPLRPGRVYLSGFQLISVLPGSRQVVADRDLSALNVPAGAELTVSGFGYGHDGTHTIEDIDGDTITLRATVQAVTGAVNLSSASASESSFTFSSDVSVLGVTAGMLLEVSGAGVNDGNYTVSQVDGTKVFVSPAVPAISGAAGTGQFRTEEGSSLGTQVYPFFSDVVEDEPIQSIDADSGDGRATIEADPALNVAGLVTSGDTLTVFGATDPANDGEYEVDDVVGDLVYLTVSLTTDQAGLGGNFSVQHETSGADGSVTIAGLDDPNDIYEDTLSGEGAKYYASIGEAQDVGPAGRYLLGRQLTEDLFMVRIQDEGGGVITLTSGANVATDGGLGNVFELVMTQAGQLDNPTNLYPGRTYLWYIIQDATGGWALTFDTAFKAPGGIGTLSLDTTADAVNILTGVVRSDGATVDVVSVESYS
jgi:hypothetical protein